jgi:hypothetical protein
MVHGHESNAPNGSISNALDSSIAHVNERRSGGGSVNVL